MDCMRANKLKLNPDKTEMLLVNGSPDQMMDVRPVLDEVTLPLKEQVPSPTACQPANKDTLQREIEVLKRKDLALDQEIAQLSAEGYSLEELEDHISLLHEYNEIKDSGQMLLGRLAVIRGVTTRELYPEFDLDVND
ncbi:DNA repair protein SWI5 homolog [Rhineura floridana]|uniref:DNA repair protein SWI5 homolog n=1 Tax=Rhineura floridana TaxID=261503 RepID=UPI002AC80F40|nr:DNA repair protein SWI5 homolog [Rhineura floridana]